MKLQKTHIFICLIFFSLMSCQNKEKNKAVATEQILKWNDTLPHIVAVRKNSFVANEKLDIITQTKIDSFCNKYWTPTQNVALLIAKNGNVVFEKYEGTANKNSGKRIDSITPLHIASVSKVITATAVLLLIDAGRLTLDQTVKSVLPTFPYETITIKDLLDHRTGMRNYAYFTAVKGVWDRKVTLRNKDILKLLSEKNISLENKPNTRFFYCNTNYAILALIVEKKTGLSFKDAIKRMIFDPLDMKDSFVFDFDTDRQRAITSYKGEWREIGYDYLDAIYGDKNIYSTPRDLLKFDIARNNEHFLTPNLREQIYKGYSNEQKGNRNYGLGIRMVNFPTGQNYYFHNGWWHGNTASYITLQKEKVTIITLSNKYTTLTYKSKDFATWLGDYPFVKKDSIGN